MSFSRSILKALVMGTMAVSMAGFSGQASATVDQSPSKQMSPLINAVTAGDLADAGKSYTKVASKDRGPKPQRYSPHGRRSHPGN